jgi:ATP-dependent helicase HepA
MTGFIPGQRWISDSEPELGLGTVLKREGRTVTLLFMAAGETRVYAMQNAPLTRVQFGAGDQVESHQGWSLVIDQVEQQQGLLSYRGRREDGSEALLKESELSNLIRFSKPQDRLLAGQIDPSHWFDLRYQTYIRLGHLQQSPLLGLAGGRIDLIPHQLYIAHEVANRPSPRVLLADEVGLGKTIEACLILHHQLLTGRASRVLILVPDPLLHQWLVELLRRFNLQFSILDEERCEAIQASEQAQNPFHAEQLVLCSLNLFRQNPHRQSQALAGEWDLLIVDEAHHLSWSAQQPSLEYRLVEALAQITPGILLLTATPEQLGLAGHFARLRLLDPDRYYDLASFLEEEDKYQPVAEAVDLLLHEQPLPEAATRQLLETLGEADSESLLQLLNDPQADPAHRAQARLSLIEMLLDRHGTGRVLFRNTRVRIKGFPGRQLHTYALPMPAPYTTCLQEANASIPLKQRLSPERLYSRLIAPDWTKHDPRVGWLIDFLRASPERKVLLICSHAASAIELQQVLRGQAGITAALFHEGMSIVERDRAAAWFADLQQGARILLCSEIGSEGRNFQFAQHLVLFDLPLDPDLLEQRIGRLDRIGQRATVQIHVPYLEPSPQATLLHWFEAGLDAFRQHVPGAQSVREQLEPLLLQALEEQPEAQELTSLLATTRRLCDEAADRLHKGRDHLLELSSCREPTASQLVEQLAAQDQDRDLKTYLQRVFNSFNVESEPLGQDSYFLRPGAEVVAGSLPGLDAEGICATFSRPTALSHEDRQFLTWEHPLVCDSMQLIIDQQTGNSSAISYRHPRLTAGQLLFEGLYVLNCVAPRNLHPGRFLPPTLVRVLINEQGIRLDAQFGCEQLTDQGQPLDNRSLGLLLREYRKPIQQLLALGQREAQKAVPQRVNQAINQMMDHYTEEIQRLVALRRHNPNVRPEEVEALQAQGLALHQHLQAAALRLDGMRLVVTV